MNKIENKSFNKRIILIISVILVVVIFLVITIPTVLLVKFSNKNNNFNEENNTNCGIPDIIPNLRIVGGVEATPNSWPYSVLLVQTYETDLKINSLETVHIIKNFFCGGTIISKRTILTAAHCVILGSFEYYDTYGIRHEIQIQPNKYFPTIESMFNVYAGLHDNDFKSLSKSVVSKVLKIKAHEFYNHINLNNDIALLILPNELSISSKVKIACLPNKLSYNYPLLNQVAWAVGWGSIYEGGPSSTSLKNVNFTIYDSFKCKNVLPSYIKNWDSQICAGEYSGGQDTCQGDSGGALYVKEIDANNSSRYIVSGITSYGDGCAMPGTAGIYTRTSYFLDWIKNNWS